MQRPCANRLLPRELDRAANGRPRGEQDRLHVSVRKRIEQGAARRGRCGSRAVGDERVDVGAHRDELLRKRIVSDVRPREENPGSTQGAKFRHRIRDRIASRRRRHDIDTYTAVSQCLRCGRADGRPPHVRRRRLHTIEQRGHASFAREHDPVILADTRASALDVAVGAAGPNGDRGHVQHSEALALDRLALPSDKLRTRVDDRARVKRHEALQLVSGVGHRPRQRPAVFDVM